MEIKNKTILALGDSFTSMNTYLVVLKELTGAKEVINYGVGGTTIAKRKKLLGNQFDRDFIGRVSEMQNDADVVLVFGGTNDYGHGDVPIGNNNDESEDTFCGCVNILVQSLLLKYPMARIVFITPTPRIGQDNPYGEDGKKDVPLGTLEEYVIALKSVIKRFSLPILDLYNDEDFSLNNKYFWEYIREDGLHPTDKGHTLLAQKISTFLEKL